MSHCNLWFIQWQCFRQDLKYYIFCPPTENTTHRSLITPIGGSSAPSVSAAHTQSKAWSAAMELILLTLNTRDTAHCSVMLWVWPAPASACLHIFSRIKVGGFQTFQLATPRINFKKKTHHHLKSKFQMLIFILSFFPGCIKTIGHFAIKSDKFCFTILICLLFRVPLKL